MFNEVVAIIQTRMGSSRFPAKTLEVVYDKSLLEHIIERVRAARSSQRIVVATTSNPADDPIEALAARVGVSCFRGSERDVLARFHGAATEAGAGVVVRLCGDDPFKDPEIVDQAVELFRTHSSDYCSNTLRPTFPEGLDVEVFSYAALDRAFNEARLESEREHVTPYIWKHPDKFVLRSFTHERDLSHMRWTIDYEDDLKFTREVYRRLYPQKRIFLMRDILELLAAEPAIAEMNCGVPHHEGYLLSLARESKSANYDQPDQ